jgi:hypothetical protein
LFPTLYLRRWGGVIDCDLGFGFKQKPQFGDRRFAPTDHGNRLLRHIQKNGKIFHNFASMAAIIENYSGICLGICDNKDEIFGRLRDARACSHQKGKIG